MKALRAFAFAALALVSYGACAAEFPISRSASSFPTRRAVAAT